MTSRPFLPGLLIFGALGACRGAANHSDAATSTGLGGAGGSVAGSTGTAGSAAGSGPSGATGTAGSGAGSVGTGAAAGSSGTAGTGAGGTVGAGGTTGAGGAGDAPAAACEGVDAGSLASRTYVDLDISASGFAEHEGKTVLLETRGNSDGVLGVAKATVTGGGFTIHLPKGYRRAQDQELLWLIDVDGDGVCNDAAGDQTGYVVVTAADPPDAAALAVAITDNHVRKTKSNVDLCNPAQPFGDMLDIDITAVGFDAHEGQTVRLLTRTVDNGAIFGAGRASVVGGGFAFHFPRGFERFTYQEILYFVDTDGDGRCVGGTDHTSYTVTPAFNPIQNGPVSMQIMDNHTKTSARGADVCVVMNGCPIAP